MLLSLFVGAAALSAQGVQSFTLRSALERASEANFDLLLGEERVVAAEQALRRARASFYPQVSAEASQGRSKNVSAFPSGDEGEVGLVGFTNNRFSAALRTRLTIFDVDTLANARIARFETEIARLQLNQTVEDIRAAVADIYFTHLRNLRQADTIEAQIARDRVLLDLASKRAEAGTATQLDVTRAEVRLANSELRLTQQQAIIFESGINLQQALNLNLAGTVELDPVALDATAPVRFSMSTLEAVLVQRPEVVAQRRLLERNEVALKAARYQRVPSVELSGDYGYAAANFDDDLENVWSIQLGISMPLFEGFRIDANQMEAASAVRAQMVALDQIESQIEAEYRLALSQVETAARSVSIARKQVELAERELELARRRFSEGVANNSEVVDAQASLAEAEDGLVASEYRFNLARLALARAEGDVFGLVRS